MKLREMLSKAVKPRLHESFGTLTLAIPEFDEDDCDEDDEPAKLGSLSGFALVLEYQDSKGQKSQRVVTCKEFSVRAGKEYLRAFCHKREAIRSFRIDRILDIFDPTTGESLSPVQAFFAGFSPDRITKSGLNWGLSVGRKADLVAMLNALIFLARCDREFHPSERASLENALTSFWLRLEILGDPDFEDMLHYADKLSPDGEIFWLAMHRFREDPLLAEIFQRNSRLLIEADGIIHEKEAYWALEIDEFLREQ